MTSRALVYKVQDYGETSKLLFIYTPTGKYTLVARGAKNYKNNFFHLADYCNLIEIDLDLTKSMQTLKKGKLLNSYENLKNDYKSFKIISKIFIIIDKILINVDHQDKIFNLIIELLEYENLELAYLSLLVKLTYSLGYRLTFQDFNIKGFNLKLGRTVSLDENIELDLDLTLTLYLKIIYYTKQEPKIEDKYIYSLFEFIKEYYKYHIDYKIKDL